MGAETVVEEPAAPPRLSSSETSKPETSKAAEPVDEFEAMRRRVHEEARAAAEEMRRDPEGDGDPD